MLDLANEEIITLDGGRLVYWPMFVDIASRPALFATLRSEIPWEQSRIRIAGRTIPIPRLNAWYGDADYSYSGVKLKTRPWTPTLLSLKQQVESVSGEAFNSALVNLYRHGADSVDWHSDDEPELGKNPQVASLSLGAVRRFELKHRTIPKSRYRIDLPDGSLLLMAGALQHYWQHRVPKQGGIAGERINITFRLVQTRLHNNNGREAL